MLLPLLRTYPRRRLFSTLSPTRENDFTHCVIGGGVVGLAIARQLAMRDGTSTILLERNNAVGTETSSRNSEVIHAGLYYPPGSLKTNLCIQGSLMLYELCKKHGIPHWNTGKWIVAQDESQLSNLTSLYEHATSHEVPMNWLTPSQTSSREPHVRAAAGALESPRTGIVDVHALMQYLLGAFTESGGDVALSTAVSSITPLAGGGYKIQTSGPESTEITADCVINAAGHGAVAISNLILPAERHMRAYYCKGTYFSYSAPFPKVSTLIYPAPVKGFGGLGTHLTLDMAGRIRFGPDVEWIDDANDLTPNESRLGAAVAAIKTYLPAVDENALAPDYCGIRPKVFPENQGGVGQVDFIIREENGFDRFVNLLGIESPGLTSCLAIAEKVDSILYK